MQYIITKSASNVYLETIDADGDAEFLRINGNTVEQVEQMPNGRIDVASGNDGDWHDFAGQREYRTPTWKISVESGKCEARTGDGIVVPYLFSGVEKHHTGETAQTRLLAFFGVER